MIKRSLLKKTVTVSLMGVLALSPVLIARANPGAVFSSRASGGTSDTVDNPDTVDEPDNKPSEPENPGTPGNPSTPENPGTPGNPGTPENPGDFGNSGGFGGSDGGSSTTSTSSGNAVATTSSVMVGGTAIRTTVTGEYRASAVNGIAITTPLNEVMAAIGVGANERAYAKIENSVCGQDSVACMEKKLAEILAISPQASSGPALDIWLGKMASANQFEKTLKAGKPIEIKIGIPDSFKTAGFEYALILVQADGTTTVLVDTDADADVITFTTDVFGTFTLIKAPAGSFDRYR